MYVIYGAGLYATVWRTFFRLAEMTRWEQLYWEAFLFPLGITYFLWAIFHPYYIQLNENKITIVNEFFFKETFPADRVAKVEVAVLPWSKSSFVLDNLIRYEFYSVQLYDRDLKKMVELLGVPLVYL